MTTQRTISGLASAILLLGALPSDGFQVQFPGVPDTVTWEKCEKPGVNRRRRILRPQDTNATILDNYECKTSLTEINADAFIGIPNIIDIRLYYNDIFYVDTSAFRAVPNLMSLHLSNNKLRESPVFEHTFNLKFLYLDSNKITRLHNPRTFSACAGLNTLGLQDNLIEYIHPEIFRPLTMLMDLCLNKNRLAYIPSDLFISNTGLWSLWLHDNRLSFLPAGFVSSLKHPGCLNEVSLYNNPWVCECLAELQTEVQKYDCSFAFSKGQVLNCVSNGTKHCYRNTPALN